MNEMDAGTGESGEQQSPADPLRGQTDDPQREPAPDLPFIPTLPSQLFPVQPTSTAAATGPSAQRAYRSEQARSKAVYRRANPWWRRALRAVIGICILGAAGIVVYFGVGLVQDFLGRDRLPLAGTEAPDIGSASFQITSSSPSATIDGTLSLDVDTSAFEFVGGTTGPQEGVQVVSPDGTASYIRTPGTEWRPTTSDDSIVGALQAALPFLLNVDGPDAVLENRLRQGDIDLIDQVNEGVGDDELRRYELELDTASYSENWPLQWNDYRNQVVPALGIGSAVPLVMTLDDDNVVVRLSAPESNWAWERLTFSEFGISITDPTRS